LGSTVYVKILRGLILVLAFRNGSACRSHNSRWN